MITPKDSVKAFSEFLCLSWNTIEKVEAESTIESLRLDWMQANWELLVEGDLCKFPESLEVYGDGADCNGGSSRVLYPNIIATHSLVCMPTHQEVFDQITNSCLPLKCTDTIDFDRLVSLDGRGWYEEKPPFDCLVGYIEESKVVVRTDDLDFIVVRH